MSRSSLQSSIKSSSISSPPSKSPFPYQPLRDPAREIRLLRPITPISRWKTLVGNKSSATGPRSSRQDLEDDVPTQWELVHERPGGEGGTPYYCLSYTWDDGDESHAVIVDKTTITITKHLHDALRECRKLCSSLNIQPWALWVDAICINQRDDVEKSFQVQQMRAIYQRAAWVLIWLGPRKDYSDWAIERMESLSQKASQCEIWKFQLQHWPDIVAAEDTTGMERAEKLDEFLGELAEEFKKPGAGPLFPIVKLMERAYWERVWILQEVAVATSAVVLCGNRNITWRRFRLATQMLQLLALALKSIGLLTPQVRADFSYLQSRVTPILLSCDNITQAEQPFSIYEPKTLKYLLIESSINAKMHVTNPRDRVFALLGMASDQKNLSVTIDYSKSVEQVYFEVATSYLLKRDVKGSLNLLSYCTLDPSHNWPSWVPDWRLPIPRPISPLGEPIKRGRYFLDPIQPQTLEVKLDAAIYPVLVLEGHEIDRVKVLGDCYPDLEDPARVEKIIRWLEQLMHFSETNGSEELNTHAARQNAVLKTAIADWEFDSSRDNLQRASDSSVSEIYKILTGITEPPGETAEERRAWVEQKTGPFRSAMDWSATKRRSFASRDERIGIAPKGLKAGDSIAEIAGADVPFALRRGEGGRWRLVGEVYLHGVMDGEHRHRYFEKLSWPEKHVFEVY